MLSPRLIELPRFFGAVATAVLAQPGLHPAFRASFGLRRALCRSVSTGRIFAAAWQGLLKGLWLQVDHGFRFSLSVGMMVRV